MDTVTVSPKFQVVIPRRVREKLGIRAGQKVQVVLFQGRLELIPVEPVKKLRGYLAGLDSNVERDEDRL